MGRIVRGGISDARPDAARFAPRERPDQVEHSRDDHEDAKQDGDDVQLANTTLASASGGANHPCRMISGVQSAE